MTDDPYLDRLAEAEIDAAAPMDPAAYLEEAYRHQALTLSVKIMEGVAASGRTVPVVRTLELADHFAAYLRDGTIPERSRPGTLSGVVE